MSKIEWERQPDGIIAGHADFVRYQAYEGEQETWQRIHNARVTEIARANGYVKLEPGQAVVPASALASAIRELRWLASSANLVSPGLWKEENSWTVSEFNNAIRAALEGK